MRDTEALPSLPCSSPKHKKVPLRPVNRHGALLAKRPGQEEFGYMGQGKCIWSNPRQGKEMPTTEDGRTVSQFIALRKTWVSLRVAPPPPQDICVPLQSLRKELQRPLLQKVLYLLTLLHRSGLDPKPVSLHVRLQTPVCAPLPSLRKVQQYALLLQHAVHEPDLKGTFLAKAILRKSHGQQTFQPVPSACDLWSRTFLLPLPDTQGAG